MNIKKEHDNKWEEINFNLQEWSIIEERAKMLDQMKEVEDCLPAKPSNKNGRKAPIKLKLKKMLIAVVKTITAISMAGFTNARNIYYYIKKKR